MELKFVCDDQRHLVCIPYSVENLHKMAEVLGIKKCWYSIRGILFHPHYDIPKKRIEEITAKCELVNFRDIVKIIKGEIK